MGDNIKMYIKSNGWASIGLTCHKMGGSGLRNRKYYLDWIWSLNLLTSRGTISISRRTLHRVLN